MIEVVIKRSGLTSDKVDPTDPMSYITRYDHMYWILMLIIIYYSFTNNAVDFNFHIIYNCNEIIERQQIN